MLKIIEMANGQSAAKTLRLKMLWVRFTDYPLLWRSTKKSDYFLWKW